jgi:hypothetical protein
MFKNFFSKIVPIMRQCRKTWLNQRGHVHYNMAHMSCMLDKQGYMQHGYARAHAPAIGTNARARAHTHTHTHTHTHKY